MVAAAMKLVELGHLGLADMVCDYLPEFCGERREKVSIRQLMSHRSGLPDQVKENIELRSQHATLEQFVDHAVREPLLFEPGQRFHYSSMGILLLGEVIGRVTEMSLSEFVRQSVFSPLSMLDSALGTEGMDCDRIMRCQTDQLPPEVGGNLEVGGKRKASGGVVDSKQWDWNSEYWRLLGAPWGGVFGTASDVAIFLDEFLRPSGRLLLPRHSRMMIHREPVTGVPARGLGFAIGASLTRGEASELAFGHDGSTGTLCWADPDTETVFVLLTTLPAVAGELHPRDLVSKWMTQAVRETP